MTPCCLSLVYDERFAQTYGPWRAVVPTVVDRFLACGILEHGFARIRCDACAHEYLLAFSCRSRYFCPSCHAKRLARWTLWLDETLLAPVPHRQVVFTIPKRLRPYCLYRRALLGDLARLAARIVTDGGFRPDGTFVRWPGWPAYDCAALSEAFRRAVLRLFVRRGGAALARVPGAPLGRRDPRGLSSAPGPGGPEPASHAFPLTADG